ncbi:MAG: right-handed parallel beta-helix repeat-containing protein [Kiritimatiellia bacterium]|jgi:parallel beta-helix repeat protein/predicted outer membrane repeat protein
MHKLKLLLVSLLACVCVSQAATYYVAMDGDDARTGLDWANALATIGKAVSKASSGTGDTVLVSNGTYTLTKQIAISAAMTVRSVNGPEFTFVNGNYPNTTNRCFYISYPSVSAVIDGFTITNGYAAGNYGGAIYMLNGGLIRNCVISSNYAAGRGGGVFMTGTCIVENCVIVSNRTDNYGAGVHFDGAGGVLRDSTIGWNNGPNGGILAYIGGSCLVSNCTIIGNYASNHGAGIGLMTPDNLVVDCRIINNTATKHGGGIYIEKNGNTIASCSIISNSGGVGGGFYMVGNNNTVVVQNCAIMDNTATTSGGGGVFSASGTHWIRNCLIKGNKSITTSYGGAVYSGKDGSTCTVQNCTIVSNDAPTGHGGGAYSYSGWLYLENCIMTSNTAGNAARPEWDKYDANSVISFTNCLIWSAQTTELAGTGNITNQPPRFVDESAGQYQLAKESPCINTGINQDWMSTAVDLDGRSRLDRFSRLVDMGCYEYVPSGAMFSCY